MTFESRPDHIVSSQHPLGTDEGDADTLLLDTVRTGNLESLRDLLGRMRAAAGSNMDVPLLERITIQPDICHGKPVIRGLRYPVESVLEYLAAGDSFASVLKEFPDLEREDLLACLEFATRSLKVKSQHLVLA